MHRIIICNHIRRTGNMGCRKAKYVMWNAKTRSALKGNYIPHYEKYSCWLFGRQQRYNQSWFMFARKGGMETLESKKYYMRTFCVKPQSTCRLIIDNAPTPEGMHLRKQLYISSVGQRTALKLLSTLHNHQFISEIPLCEMHTVSLKFLLANIRAATSFISKFL